MEVDAEAAQDGLFGGHLHEGFVVAMAVEYGFAIEPRDREILGTGFEEFTEQEGLARKGLCAFVVGKEVDEFVAENGDATGFEADEGNAGFDGGPEFVEDPEQERLGAVEHAAVSYTHLDVYKRQVFGALHRREHVSGSYGADSHFGR